MRGKGRLPRARTWRGTALARSLKGRGSRGGANPTEALRPPAAPTQRRPWQKPAPTQAGAFAQGAGHEERRPCRSPPGRGGARLPSWACSRSLTRSQPSRSTRGEIGPGVAGGPAAHPPAGGQPGAPPRQGSDPGRRLVVFLRSRPPRARPPRPLRWPPRLGAGDPVARRWWRSLASEFAPSMMVWPTFPRACTSPHSELAHRDGLDGAVATSPARPNGRRQPALDAASPTVVAAFSSTSLAGSRASWAILFQ